MKYKNINIKVSNTALKGKSYVSVKKHINSSAVGLFTPPKLLTYS
jgi:hypothetical protein